MPLPSGVSTCTVMFGRAYNLLGENASVTITLTPSHALVWQATGEVIERFPITAVAAEGEIGSVILPHVDQDGFLNIEGDAFTDWWYSAQIDIQKGGVTQSYKQVFQVFVGQTNVDLDLIPRSGTVGPAGTAPSAVVTSVNGASGAVVIDLSDPAWEDITGKPSTFPAAARGAPDGLAPLGPDSLVPAAYLPLVYTAVQATGGTWTDTPVGTLSGGSW